jgi:hypothetical protein
MKFFTIFLPLIIVIVSRLICAAIGILLWSAIMVKVFNLPSLTYWQFYGLLILIDIFLLPFKPKTSTEDK